MNKFEFTCSGPPGRSTYLDVADVGDLVFDSIYGQVYKTTNMLVKDNKREGINWQRVGKEIRKNPDPIWWEPDPQLDSPNIQSR